MRYFHAPMHFQAAAVTDRSEAWNVIDLLEAAIAGSNPALGMDI
jgi:hypothetical protein